jgi:NDP-sugar pyrophosphorylase family protein
MLSPADLFDLSEFPHRDVFDGLEYGWEAISAIAPYLERYLAAADHPNVVEGTVLGNATLIGTGIWIGEGTVVEPGVFIKAPALIGRHCEIRHGAYIRGNVIVGDHAVVGHTTEVKNSILLNHAQAPHFAYVGDSVLGCRVNLGAGTKLANLKIVEGNVHVRVNGQVYDTGLRKFGALVGDDVQIGCNTVTSPGTILSPGCLVHPNTTPKGFYPPRQVVR